MRRKIVKLRLKKEKNQPKLSLLQERRIKKRKVKKVNQLMMKTKKNQVIKMLLEKMNLNLKKEKRKKLPKSLSKARAILILQV